MSGHLIQGNSMHQGREQEKMMRIWVISALFQDSLFYQSPCTARAEINSKGPGVTEPGLYFNFAHTLILIQQVIIEDRILSFLFSKNRVLSSTIICWIKIRVWQQLQQFKWETNKLVIGQSVCVDGSAAFCILVMGLELTWCTCWSRVNEYPCWYHAL